ncbi:conserved hypothetical protein [Alkaliphilus metalliredigens QYMF]|uniref:Uncharacterized protein n=1 Tax=Alkaliphilus metalliredigens (strain QYMF) TaxID=293826 RepID=A6TVL1_ALKMQ|nr:hypothetical protein [Alkaliphilus metalliredigens]ABR50229.1 conserved hypothetical protein [Alkaliphilus metalliredigens QYMF]
MLFRRKKAIELAENIIKKNHTPLLIRDQHWKKMIKDNENRKVIALAKSLEVLVAEELKSQRELKALTKEKKAVMSQMIHLSDQVNRHEGDNALEELEAAKENVTDINRRIEEMMEASTVYPKKIEEINLQLLKETVIIAYEKMRTTGKKQKKVDDEITKLREKLDQLRQEKEALEMDMKTTYHFLHDTVGHEEMEKLDFRFLDPKE